MSPTLHRTCHRCGNEIPDHAPQGLCSLCLFRTGLALFAEEKADGESNGRKMPRDFDDYEMLEEIGRGGQGVVYRARQKSLNRLVALKVLGVGAWATESHLRRFRREAEAAARLRHPSIVSIHAIGEEDGFSYFSMDLVEGGRLDEAAAREPFSNRRAAEYLAKLTRTVHYAHEHGILHRDIKPGNILLDRAGDLYLTDFGLARLVETSHDMTLTAEALGSPSYMAPEQAGGGGGPVTAATDVYGLGAVLYHLLTGHPPFTGKTAYETVRLVLESAPPSPLVANPAADRDLVTICLKCLEKEPARRYHCALALAEDLERWLRGEPVQARRPGLLVRGKKWVGHNRAVALLGLTLGALAALGGVILEKSEFLHPLPNAGIAVLPFDNLSENKESAFLADGVQDDILTKLAKIADLKVISRTSVMQYRGQHDIRAIGAALHVTYILEGSVQRAGGRVHLNAQLIDSRRDTHVWAEEYDGDLDDLFSLQSQIAQKVAEQLHAKVSARERLSIERPPSADIVAFDLYTRGRNLFLHSSFDERSKDDLLRAVALLNQAVKRDPGFLQAYCQLAWIHDMLYFMGHDHTEKRLALAEVAIDAAARIRPEAGEVHLARAQNYYRGHLDYAGALRELKAARAELPNDPRLFELEGFILRREGQYPQSLQDLEHALDLDPRNIFILQQLSKNYGHFRRWAEMAATLDRALAIAPNDLGTKFSRAGVEIDWKADTRPLHRLIDSSRLTDPASIHEISNTWFECALQERDPVAAQEALQARGDDSVLDQNVIHFPHAFGGALVAYLSGDVAAERSALLTARAEQAKAVEAQPDYAPPLVVLGIIDAFLGRKEEAIQEGRRALELLPVAKDAINGPIIAEHFAILAAWVGDQGLSCDELEKILRAPSSISYGDLKLSPFWDPLRGDPRFAKIVASLAPKG